MKDNEKNRKLSESEQRRLRDYQVLCEQMKEKGYRVRELTVSIVKANLFVAAAAVPVIGLGMFLFFFFHRDAPFRMMNGIVFLFAVLALTVVHELIHGLTWSVFSKDHFKDIEFGFMKEYLTPYCTCKVPLKKKGCLCLDRRKSGSSDPWPGHDPVGRRRCPDRIAAVKVQDGCERHRSAGSPDAGRAGSL